MFQGSRPLTTNVPLVELAGIEPASSVHLLQPLGSITARLTTIYSLRADESPLRIHHRVSTLVGSGLTSSQAIPQSPVRWPAGRWEYESPLCTGKDARPKAPVLSGVSSAFPRTKSADLSV